MRRKFYEIHENQKRLPGTLASQALLRIAQLYAVEAPIRGRPPDERVSLRQAHSRALLDELHAWLQDALAQVSAKSALAKAIGYAATHWTALTRYLDDGRIEMDNNAAERAIRGVALGRNHVHCRFRRIRPPNALLIRRRHEHGRKNQEAGTATTRADQS